MFFEAEKADRRVHPGRSKLCVFMLVFMKESYEIPGFRGVLKSVNCRRSRIIDQAKHYSTTAEAILALTSTRQLC